MNIANILVLGIMAGMHVVVFVVATFVGSWMTQELSMITKKQMAGSVSPRIAALLVALFLNFATTISAIAILESL